MTYRHKREKCAQETKEILEDVLKAEKEEYDCLDCADTVKVGNPIEKIIAEELPRNEIKDEAEAIIEEVQTEDISDQTEGGSKRYSVRELNPLQTTRAQITNISNPPQITKECQA